MDNRTESGQRSRNNFVKDWQNISVIANRLTLIKPNTPSTTDLCTKHHRFRNTFHTFPIVGPTSGLECDFAMSDFHVSMDLATC